METENEQYKLDGFSDPLKVGCIAVLGSTAVKEAYEREIASVYEGGGIAVKCWADVAAAYKSLKKDVECLYDLLDENRRREFVEQVASLYSSTMELAVMCLDMSAKLDAVVDSLMRMGD